MRSTVAKQQRKLSNHDFQDCFYQTGSTTAFPLLMSFTSGEMNFRSAKKHPPCNWISFPPRKRRRAKPSLSKKKKLVPKTRLHFKFFSNLKSFFLKRFSALLGPFHPASQAAGPLSNCHPPSVFSFLRRVFPAVSQKFMPRTGEDNRQKRAMLKSQEKTKNKEIEISPRFREIKIQKKNSSRRNWIEKGWGFFGDAAGVAHSAREKVPSCRKWRKRTQL